MGTTPLLSVLIPVYNEEENLADLGREVREALASLDFEAVLVDDGSTDRSYDEIQKLAKTDARFKAVRLGTNFGQTAAMAAGIAPGANIGDGVAVFEATHGTAPKYTNLDKVNPGSLILSGVMMLQHMGWNEAADLIVRALEKQIASKRVTYDLERQMPGATTLKTSQFGAEMVAGMASLKEPVAA